MRKKFTRSKERPIFSLNVAEERSGSSTVPAFPLPFPLSVFHSISLSQSRFFCFAVPNARCSLRIIKVVANLDWRELRIHSLVSARGNWCLQLQRNFGGLFNWERRCARCRKWESTLRAADVLKISLKRWKENRAASRPPVAPESTFSTTFENNVVLFLLENVGGLTKIDEQIEFLQVFTYRPRFMYLSFISNLTSEECTARTYLFRRKSIYQELKILRERERDYNLYILFQKLFVMIYPNIFIIIYYYKYVNM